jgi:hypothetical protein
MCIFLGQKKYSIWGDFSGKFLSFMQNPDKVTRFDGTALYTSNMTMFLHWDDDLW